MALEVNQAKTLLLGVVTAVADLPTQNTGWKSLMFKRREYETLLYDYGYWA